MVRHGQSVWNMENRFTGWTDVALTEKGRDEAIKAGVVLKELGYTFDVAYTSLLKRANDTLDFIFENKDKIIKRINTNLVKKANRSPKVIYYDVTNFYFEIENPDEDIVKMNNYAIQACFADEETKKQLLAVQPL